MFSPDGRFLAIGTDERLFRLWDLEAEQEVGAFAGQPWQAGGLAIHPNGQMFASSSEDNTVRTWLL